MLVLLEATFEQLGAARSRVLGETTAEQLEAVDLILVDAILGASPEGRDATTVAAMLASYHPSEGRAATTIAAAILNRHLAQCVHPGCNRVHPGCNPVH